MYTLLFSFLKKYWLQIIAISAIIAAVLYVRHLYVTVGEQRIEIARLTTVNAQCADANKTLKDLIATSNQASQQLSDFTTQQQKKMDDLASQLSSQQRSVNDKVNKLFQATKPQSCDEAIQYLIDATQEYHK